MRTRHVLTVFLSAFCAACGGPGGESPGNTAPDETLFEISEPDTPPPLPVPVIATRDELLEIAERNSLRSLARRADAEPAFISNLGGADHLRHWDLMRRTGFDPNLKLMELFELPHGTRRVGTETWYIWPDLAARSTAELAPDRLSFQDTARLRALIGEQGIEQIAEGRSYPGVRTAISETGAWRYFLHETPPQ